MKTNSKLKKLIIKLAILLFWIGVWQLVFVLVSKPILIASPASVAMKLFELVQTTSFWQSAFASILRVCEGYILGVVFGTILAVICTKFSLIDQVLSPILLLIRSTPVASCIILALVWIQKTDVAVFISFLMVVPIIWANVCKGIRTTDKKQLEMAKVYGFTPLKKVKTIYAHSVLPFFVSACTTALGLAWKAGISAEVLSMPTNSIGYNLYRSKINIETTDLFAWTIVVILLSLMFEKIIVFILNRFQKTSLEKGGKND